MLEKYKLTDEEIINLVTEYHFSGKQNRHILARNVAQAQLNKIDIEQIKKELLNKVESIISWGRYEESPNGSKIRDGHIMSERWQALKEKT